MAHLLLKLASGNTAGTADSCRFSEQGGAIGRSENCLWPLVDHQRFISKTHAVIAFQNQQFVLTDVSTNGIFINNLNNPLGHNNKHILAPSDTLILGDYYISVADINCNSEPIIGSTQEEDGDLLDLVMGNSDSPVGNMANNNLDPLAAMSSPASFNPDEGDSLGLEDIISGNESQPPQTPSYQFSSPQKTDLPESSPAPSQSPIGSNIPEDWELSGIMPAVPDFKPPITDADELIVEPNAGQPSTPIQPASINTDHPEISEEIRKESIDPIEAIINDIPVKANVPKEVVEPEKPLELQVEEPQLAQPQVATEPDIVVQPSPPLNDNAPKTSVNEGVQSTPSTDDFLTLLYTKLGLPKEYLANIDAEVFAEDIVTVLMSSTRGLMALLNGRSVFKQESRLSLTSIQPRSNNPLKFSIDPTDTLEMLLLKKKAGYMTTSESYEEAISDIQFHQMAFIAGLQATLAGVLGQLSPEDIELKAKESGRSFMGLNTSSQYWQLYKDKKELVDKQVQQNLNEVLSTHFADAYQSHIDKIKKDQH